MILHPLLQSFINLKWNNSRKFHYLHLLCTLIVIVFISVLAMEYREHSVCHEIKNGNDNMGLQYDATNDCDQFNKKNKTELVELKKKNLVDFSICNHMMNNSYKCYYAKYYSDIMNKFLEGQNETKGKIRYDLTKWGANWLKMCLPLSWLQVLRHKS